MDSNSIICSNQFVQYTYLVLLTLTDQVRHRKLSPIASSLFTCKRLQELSPAASALVELPLHLQR